MIPAPDIQLATSELQSDQGFRHSGWSHNRQKVLNAFHKIGKSDAVINSFKRCGSNAWVLESKSRPGKYKIACDRCHNRYCKPCAMERARTISKNLKHYIKGKTVRFLTLTLRSSNDPLGEQLTRLVQCFNRLRVKKGWRNSQVGGASFIEISYNNKKKRWHPHLHVISEGKYISQRELSSMWKEVSGDSFIVDVRAIKDDAKVANYVTKYASKGIDGKYINDQELLIEAMKCLHGRKVITTYGKWRGFKLLSAESEEEWICIGALAEIQKKAKSRDVASLKILDFLIRRAWWFKWKNETTDLGD